jgi:hypothetical protein
MLITRGTLNASLLLACIYYDVLRNDRRCWEIFDRNAMLKSLRVAESSKVLFGGQLTRRTVNKNQFGVHSKPKTKAIEALTATYNLINDYSISIAVAVVLMPIIVFDDQTHFA